MSRARAGKRGTDGAAMLAMLGQGKSLGRWKLGTRKQSSLLAEIVDKMRVVLSGQTISVRRVMADPHSREAIPQPDPVGNSPRIIKGRPHKAKRKSLKNKKTQLHRPRHQSSQNHQSKKKDRQKKKDETKSQIHLRMLELRQTFQRI
jgi:hypothetical protein